MHPSPRPPRECAAAECIPRVFSCSLCQRFAGMHMLPHVPCWGLNTSQTKGIGGKITPKKRKRQANGNISNNTGHNNIHPDKTIQDAHTTGKQTRQTDANIQFWIDCRKDMPGCHDKDKSQMCRLLCNEAFIPVSKCRECTKNTHILDSKVSPTRRNHRICQLVVNNDVGNRMGNGKKKRSIFQGTRLR